ncbi:MAG TPA: DNA polymerase IV [Gemmatimonadaceae bacterium]|nr:DNA polymerase IV [Gemmatimonadaceae bacterium]
MPSLPLPRTDIRSPHRRILLVDADAFFVAVARMVDPEGAGRAPLLIVGGAPGSRGVVCSASYECRRYGVRSAMPISRALRLCPAATCVPVPRRECGVKSREIAAVLGRFAPVVAPASIDEWYLDLAGTERLYDDEPLVETAQRIRRAVVEATGLTVSIGGGTSRLVAKLAVELAKPHKKPAGGGGGGATPDDDVGTGAYVVAPGNEAAFMTRFALADIPLVGPKLQERLARAGMRTVPDALRHDAATLQRLLGESTGAWLYERVRGIDDTEVEPRDEQKSVGREETFDRDLHDEPSLERELLRLAVRVSADLRGDALTARTVTVKIRDADFVTRQASRTVERGIDSERAVATVARELLRKLRRARRVGVRLLGVSLSQLAAEGEESRDERQLALFEEAPSAAAPAVESERDRTLSRTVDQIRAKFGADAIVPATTIEE